MDSHEHDEQLVRSFYEEQKEIFDTSNQAMYAFLDDTHKVCNEKFASLLEYSSKEEWAAVQESFTAAFVNPASQETLVNAYQNAMENMIGSAIPVTWRKKTGQTVDTTVILVPVAHKGHLFALHFVS